MKNILGYDFEVGYRLNNSNFNDVSGIYLIYTVNPVRILDVGETSQLRSRLINHERKLSWYLNSGLQQIFVAFHHESNSKSRLLKEKVLRLSLNPICGEK